MSRGIAVRLWRNKVHLRHVATTRGPCCETCSHYTACGCVDDNGLCMHPNGPKRALSVRFDELCDEHKDRFAGSGEVHHENEP